MIKIDSISKIGIGTYRMNNDSIVHQESLNYAIESGINLIDTASNYQNGGSEKLVGHIITKQERENTFLITKAGYAQGSDINKISQNNIKSFIKISDTFYYSLDVEFIKMQFYESLKRLNTDYLDCFLIHNPEHYFDVINPYQTKIHDDIFRVFMFLEQLIIEGKLRYYGVSSNSFPTPTASGIIFNNLVNSKNMFPNFKFIQFPYNLVENDASLLKFNNDASLLDICKENDIISLSNRPINTIYEGKVLRLSDYNEELLSQTENLEEELFSNLLLKIKNKLIDFGEYTPLEEFYPIKFFIDNRKKIANTEAVYKAVNNYLIPFLKKVEMEDSETMSIVYKLMDIWILYSKRDNSLRLAKFKETLTNKGIIDKADSREFSVIACDSYLKTGISHVLMGMRDKKYIDKILSLL
jgi:aryl-alcohol dehydrogenase-like predicted oxidoreductase